MWDAFYIKNSLELHNLCQNDDNEIQTFLVHKTKTFLDDSVLLGGGGGGRSWTEKCHCMFQTVLR